MGDRTARLRGGNQQDGGCRSKDGIHGIDLGASYTRSALESRIAAFTSLLGALRTIAYRGRKPPDAPTRRPSAAEFARIVSRVPRAANLIRQHGRPPAVLYFGVAPGDDLLATAVVRQWHRVRGSKPWYMTKHPEIFEGHPDVGPVLEYSPELAGAFTLLGTKRYRLTYHEYDAATDRSIAPAGTHIINLMCAAAGLPPMDDPAPLIVVPPSEVRPAPSRRIIVQSSVLGAAVPIRNKEWFVDRMQAVVSELSKTAEILQMGSAQDPPLRGAQDYRGRTSVREAAGLLAASSLFIGMVGFLMHLARAVGTRSVIVYGGREHPSQSGYAINRNLFTELPCSPCWLWNHCPYEHECMQRITAADVVAAARELLRTGAASEPRERSGAGGPDE